tara:strand:- start:44 stop:574 length:531 start_codon:yes stop_codon:yes gene_type:complete
MGYLGLKSYAPESFRDLAKFVKYAHDIFTNTKGKVFNGYRAAFNQDYEFCQDCPLVLNIGENHYEISTQQDEEISLTKNYIDFEEEIVWLAEDTWKWQKRGVLHLDALKGSSVKHIKIVGLDYGASGVAIHGILIDFLDSQGELVKLLIRTNYDRIELMELDEDTAEEPKIFEECF